jgi:hypothetical protein
MILEGKTLKPVFGIYNKEVFFFSLRCQQVVEKAFLSWNDKDHCRRLREVQLLTDVTDDYQPTKQVRSISKRNLSLMDLKVICKKSKGSKSTAIKCM